ncbi:hypothetical protein FHS40_009013 [Streptomyces spectabilis]|uniref:Uncharacterized protein n=1 Tax=Streptomyces spectabilis TaxID=68270 RepID=A0A7W8B7B7_STRST|nr:hypothetical protein [Streptomyces spectabilis]
MCSRGGGRGVCGDGLPGQVQAVEQGLEPGDLIRLPAGVDLSQDDAAVVVEGGHQMHLSTIGGVGASCCSASTATASPIPSRGVLSLACPASQPHTAWQKPARRWTAESGRSSAHSERSTPLSPDEGVPRESPRRARAGRPPTLRSASAPASPRATSGHSPPPSRRTDAPPGHCIAHGRGALDVDWLWLWLFKGTMTTEDAFVGAINTRGQQGNPRSPTAEAEASHRRRRTRRKPWRSSPPAPSRGEVTTKVYTMKLHRR